MIHRRSIVYNIQWCGIIYVCTYTRVTHTGVLWCTSVADLRGGGFRGFKPPPLGCQKKKKLMCIEKRHHNYVQTHTVCSYSTLSQAQPQTIGFNPPPPPLGLPSEHVTLSWTAFYGLHCVSRCQENITYGGSNLAHKKIGSPLRGSWTMVSIALVDARKTSLTGVQNSQKIGSPLRGSWTMVSIALVDARKTSLMGVQNSKKNRLAATRLVDDAPHRRWVKPPPWKKARSAPVPMSICSTLKSVNPKSSGGSAPWTPGRGSAPAPRQGP